MVKAERELQFPTTAWTQRLNAPVWNAIKGNRTFFSKYLVLKSTTRKFKVRSVYDFGALQEYLGHIVSAITTIFSQQWQTGKCEMCNLNVSGFLMQLFWEGSEQREEMLWDQMPQEGSHVIQSPGGKPHGEKLHARAPAYPRETSFLSHVHQEHKAGRAPLENGTTVYRSFSTWTVTVDAAGVT